MVLREIVNINRMCRMFMNGQFIWHEWEFFGHFFIDSSIHTKTDFFQTSPLTCRNYFLLVISYMQNVAMSYRHNLLVFEEVKYFGHILSIIVCISF